MRAYGVEHHRQVATVRGFVVTRFGGEGDLYLHVFLYDRQLDTTQDSQSWEVAQEG